MPRGGVGTERTARSDHPCPFVVGPYFPSQVGGGIVRVGPGFESSRFAMASEPDPRPSRRYTAFLSYSHKDEGFVIKFHRQLERWKIPRSMVGRKTIRGEVPPTLRPVFRDRDDFAGEADLKDATHAALDASSYLLVFCSPNAARSPHVNEEVRLFKAMGRSENVIPIIIGGEPGGGEEECFPQAVKYKVDEDGTVLPESAEPLAPDAREIGDGSKRALAKVVAGMLGVPFDEIIRRAERARRNRFALLAGAAAGAFVFATGFASYALYRSQLAEATIGKSVFALGRIVQETDRLGEEDIETQRRDMLRSLCDLMEGLAPEGEEIGLIEKTICLCEQAHAIGGIGESEEALAGISEWMRELERDFENTESPSFEQATALVKVSREWTLLQMEFAGEDASLVGPGLELVETIVDVGTRRPDIDYVRKVHEEVVWPLIENLESAGDFQRSADLMEQAAGLRAMQVEAQSGLDSVYEAQFENGVYLRRSAWARVIHLEDAQGAVRLAREAVSLWETMVPEGDGKMTSSLAYQTVLAHQVLGQALEAADDMGAARESFVAARSLAQTTRGDLADDDEWVDAFEGSIAFLEERLERSEP